MGELTSKQVFRLAENDRIDPKIVDALRKRLGTSASDRKLEMVAEDATGVVHVSLTPSEIEQFLWSFPNYHLFKPKPTSATLIPARDSSGNALGEMNPSSYLGTMIELHGTRGHINPGGNYSLGN